MSDYTTKATVELDVNGQKAKQELEQQRKLVKDLEIAYAKAEASGDKSAKTIHKELSRARRELKSMQSATVNAADVLRRLDKATPKELKATLKQLNKELNSIQRGTDAWNAHVDKIHAVKKELESVNSTIATQRTRWQKLGDFINKWQTMAVAAFAIVMKVVSAGRNAVNAYASIDQEMANTRKFTGMTREEVESLNEEFKKMDTRTGREGLNKLAQSAGRLGKDSVEDVLGFVRAGDKISVAMDELGTDAPEIISKLSGIFNLETEMGTEKAMLSTGSAVNTLSQVCAASAPNLVDFASRFGAIASSSNMAMSEMLAFGAVLDSNGVTMEKGATAMQGVVTRMYAEPSKFAKIANLDAKEFTKTLKRSSTEGLMMFIDRLSQMDQMQMSATLKELGTAGAGVTQTFQTLANKSEELKTRMQQSNKAFIEATSVDEEFAIQNNTVQAGLDKAKEKFRELQRELGEKLAPVMKHVISSSGAIVRVLIDVISFVDKYKGVIAVLTASILAYNIAVHASAIKTKTLAAVQAIAKTATVAWTAVTYISTAAVALLSGNVTRATAAFKLFSNTLKLSPIGLLVAGITAVVSGLTMWTLKSKNVIDTQKTINEIKSKANEKLAEEKTHIELLVAAAENEKLSLDERKKAIDKLNGIIPNYNAQLDETTGKYKANKTALDDYLKSLAKKYEIEGAKEQLAEIGREKARLQTERVETEKALDEAKKRNSTASGGGTPTPQTSGGTYAPSSYHAAIGNSAEIAALENKISGIDSALRTQESRRITITNIFGNDLMKDAISESDIDPEDGPPQGDFPPADDSDDRFKTEKDWKEREEALNRISYATGQKSYEDYRKRIDEIAVEYFKKLMNHTEASADEQLQYKSQYYDALQKQQETNNAISIESENARHLELVAAEKQRYINGQTSLEAYNNTIAIYELEHKRRIVSIYKEGTQERLKAEQDYQEALFQDMQRRQNNISQKIKDFQKKYLQKSASEQMSTELAALDALYEQKLIKEEDYQKAKTAIASEYLDKMREEHATPKEKIVKVQKDKTKNEDLLNTAFENGLISAEEYQRRMAELTANMHRTIANGLKNTGNEWITMFANVYESFSGFIASLKGDSTGMLENLSNLVGATSAVVLAGMQVSAEFAKVEADIQIAALEKRYDKEISLAEGNSYKVKKIEKQKEKETARIKADANKKQFSVQVIQAIAQTITAGLNAYASTLAIPVVGPMLAPAAMALAVATGMMQVALLKKQQQASEAQGYASGGFTPKGGKYEPAGIVHKGEWVASQELLASPVARPMIEALDYAQRTNTIGSLKADDVSRTISAPTIIASSNNEKALSESLTAQAVALAGYVSVIRRLNERLDEPFVTVNTVTGDTGIKKAQDDYDKLIRNKTPKSKRS